MASRITVRNIQIIQQLHLNLLLLSGREQ